MKLIATALLLALANNAFAAVYKCRADDGSLAFQDSPCEGTGELTDIDSAPPPRSADAGLAAGTYDMSRRHEARVEQGLLDRQSSGQALKTELAHKQKVQDAIRGRRIIKGMSFGEARQSWGPPSEILRSHKGERWIYRRNGRRHGSIRFDKHGSVGSARWRQR